MMKTNLKVIASMALLLLFGLGLTGCARTGSGDMMDDSMTAPKENMESGTMQEQHDDMSGSMDTMKEGPMEESMPAPMQHMEKDAMHSDMSGTMN